MSTRNRLKQAALVAVVIAAALALTDKLGFGLPLLLMLVSMLGLVAYAAPQLGVRWLDDLILLARSWLWRHDHGSLHSFGGLRLEIEDIHGEMWIAADSLQRAINQREPEDVTAARLAGQWRRNHNGDIMLNVKAVVQHLATMPDRSNLRVQRFRRYLERDVLYPAARRRNERSG